MCSGVTVSSIMQTGASIGFTPGSGNTSFVVSYTPSGGSTTTVSPNPTSSPVVLTGLTGRHQLYRDGAERVRRRLGHGPSRHVHYPHLRRPQRGGRERHHQLRS